MITRGDHLARFEQEIAEYTGARYAVAFNSCSTALAASFFAVDVGPSDRIITTPNTFVASCGYACNAGAVPVFVDIDRKTGNIDVERLSFNLEPVPSRGKNIIVPVHFAGIPVDMRHLESYIKDLNTVIIEDAAHAIGSSYKDGSKVGSCAYSHITCFSFHPAKTITTGEGGMCTTNHEPLYRRLLDYRNNGIERDPSRGPWVYDVKHLTGNFWMNEMQAALGSSQFARLPKFIEKRKKLVNRYLELLSNQEGIELFAPDASLDIAWHLFVVQIDFSKFNKTRVEVMGL
jgi:dTDP-4-amino-4,6-dideoxygalactose transaminase